MAASQNLEAQSLATFRASGAIPARRLVKYHTVEDEVILCTAITDVAIGVSTTTAASGEMVEIQTSGVALLETTAAAVAIGAQVMPAAGGAGRCATTAGATSISVGIAASASGGTTAGETIKVRLKVPNVGGPVNT